MTPDQFEERLRLSIDRHRGRFITQELLREIEDDIIAELCDIEDDIKAGAVSLK